MISWITSASKSVLLGILAIWGVAIIGTLVGVAVLKSSLERAERLSHLTQDELFESLARQRKVSASKTAGSSKGLSGGKNWGSGEHRLIRATPAAETTEQSGDRSASETDASASSEETR